MRSGDFAGRAWAKRMEHIIKMGYQFYKFPHLQIAPGVHNWLFQEK